MTDKSLDVLCIGNAIVDVIAAADDAFLAQEGLDKGSMRLIDAGEATRLYGRMGPGREISGGSAGLRMMTALPRSAPPTFSMACEVVSVNSSMLARVRARRTSTRSRRRSRHRGPVRRARRPRRSGSWPGRRR